MKILTLEGSIIDVYSRYIFHEFYSDCHGFYSDADGFFSQSYVLACTDEYELPKGTYIFADYPGVFDIIAAENCLDPAEWILSDHRKYHAPRIYTNIAHDLNAYINRYGWIVSINDISTGSTIRYSKKYDTFFRIVSPNTLISTRLRADQEEIIRKIYKGGTECTSFTKMEQ